MSNILYVGDFYPLFSYKSRMTELIVHNLSERGHKVILLSKSWCVVNEDDFYGTAEQLAQNKPFYKRYYIDPIQLKVSGLELINAFVGLACKIIEYEDVEQIIFAENLKYSMMIELLKARYHIPCYLFLFEKKSLKCMVDDYMIPYMGTHLAAYDGIYTYPAYREFLVSGMQLEPEKIYDAEPVHSGKGNQIGQEQISCIYVFCKNCTTEKMKNIRMQLEQKTGVQELEICFVGEEKNMLEEQEKRLMAPSEIPAKSVISFEEILMDKEPVNESRILAVCASGFIPLVSKNIMNDLMRFEVKYAELGEYCAIQSLAISDIAVDEYFIM